MSETVYQDKWLTVVESGSRATIRFSTRAVGIVALDDGRMPLVRQYRHGAGLWTCEIPQGGAPLDEEPLHGAQRELREETGIEADDWLRLGSTRILPSFTDCVAHLFLARGLRYGPTDRDLTESDMTIEWVTFAEALGRVRSGEIADSLSVEAILRLALP